MVMIVLWLDSQLHVPVKSVPITIKVVGSNPIPGEVYSMQHYVIKFTSCLSMIGGSLQVLWLLPSLKLVAII